MAQAKINIDHCTGQEFGSCGIAGNDILAEWANLVSRAAAYVTKITGNVVVDDRGHPLADDKDLAAITHVPDGPSIVHEELAAFYVVPYILAFNDAKYQIKNVTAESDLRSASTMVLYFAPNFARRKTNPAIGKKLTATLIWTYVSPQEYSKDSSVNCHVQLLLIDYRKDWPPFDVYVYEPLKITNETPAKRCVSTRIKTMLEFAAQHGRKGVISKSCKGTFLYGKQSYKVPNCFEHVTNVIEQMYRMGASAGLEWLLSVTESRPITRWI